MQRQHMQAWGLGHRHSYEKELGVRRGISKPVAEKAPHQMGVDWSNNVSHADRRGYRNLGFRAVRRSAPKVIHRGQFRKIASPEALGQREAPFQLGSAACRALVKFGRILLERPRLAKPRLRRAQGDFSLHRRNAFTKSAQGLPQ